MLPMPHPPNLKSNRAKNRLFQPQNSMPDMSPRAGEPCGVAHAADQTHRAPRKATTASQGPVELVLCWVPIPRMDLLYRTFALLYGHGFPKLGMETNPSRARNMEVGIHMVVAALSGRETEELCYH